jgi:hypothetical protein
LVVELKSRTNKHGRKLIAIDVGCGSGWKLVNFLSAEFHTIGIETEPALTFLRNKYPDQVYFLLFIILADGFETFLCLADP